MLELRYSKDTIEVGCDEAGRGCLAGPVFAAAVILPNDFEHPLLNDSKKLTERQRIELRSYIEKHAVAYGVASLDHEEIDKINILNASFKAMHLAVDQLSTKPELILVDGNRFSPYLGVPHVCIVKGDAKYMSIAAASILAKTYRDDYMMKMHEKYPNYAWNTNKGYPTKAHRLSIAKHGVTPIHRLSFRLLP